MVNLTKFAGNRKIIAGQKLAEIPALQKVERTLPPQVAHG